MNSTSKGFTLIELLVIIAIIGILSLIVLETLSGGTERARDAKRIAEAKNIQRALLLYSEDNNGAYPTASGNSCAGTLATALDPLISGGYLPEAPNDPVNTGSLCHFYYGNPSFGACNTPSAPFSDYYLFFRAEAMTHDLPVLSAAFDDWYCFLPE